MNITSLKKISIGGEIQLQWRQFRTFSDDQTPNYRARIVNGNTKRGIINIHVNIRSLYNKMSEPSPYAILLSCLQRNYGLGDTNIKVNSKAARNPKFIRFSMTVNEKTVEVTCKSKREGKIKSVQHRRRNMLPGTLIDIEMRMMRHLTGEACWRLDPDGGVPLSRRQHCHLCNAHHHPLLTKL